MTTDKTFLFALLFCAFFISCSNGNNGAGPDGTDNGGVFVDEFETFDSSSWTKETHEAGWVNQELQSYHPSFVRVGKDGDKSVLIISAERKNGKIISGRVNSKGKKSFKYGRVEASIKLPATANGLWPAFWFMGDNDKLWPSCGEIDLMEMGDADGIASGETERRVNTAIHFGEDQASHHQEYYAASVSDSLQDGEYHTYAMDWSQEEIKVSIDGVHFKSFDISANPYFHDNFYVLFNLAVGGAFTGITEMAGITAINEGEKVSMYVDWIKIISNN